MEATSLRLFRSLVIAGCAVLSSALGMAAGTASPPDKPARITLSEMLKEQPLDQLFHTGWGVREGFHGMVMGIAQTTDGYLWVGTSQSLFRFDGVRFERFDSLAGQALPGNAVLSLFATPDNGLWVGFLNGGAAFVRDGRVLFTEPSKTGWGASTRAFVMEKDGTLWGANSRGLFRREGQGWHEMGKAEGYPAVGPGQYTVDAKLDGDGNLWAFTTRSLYVKPVGQTRFQEVPTGGRMVTEPAVDPQGRIWARVGKRYHRLPRPGVPGDELGTGRPMHGSLFMPTFDRQGYLWYGALDGVVRERVADQPVDSKAEFDESFTADLPVPLVPLSPASGPLTHGAGQGYRFGAPALQRLTPTHGLTGDRVVKVFQDREGSMWIGTNGGLDRLRPTRVPTFQLPVRAHSLALAAGPKGDLWITSRVGLQHLTANPQGPDLETFPSQSVSMSAVLVDHTGTVWMGDQAGLSRLTPDGKYVNELKEGIPDWNGGVTALMEDATGSIWVMAQSFGPLRRSPDGKWERLAGTKGYPNAIFSCMTVDAQGRIWMGTVGNRVLLVESGDRVTRLNEKNGIAVGDVHTIKPGKGYLWIAGELGVQRRDEDGTMHTIKAVSDQALRGITGFVETPEGDLWLNGEAGITRIKAADVRRAMTDPSYRVPVLQLGTLDGLPGRAEQDWPLDTATRTADGRLWFSLTNALVTIDPATVDGGNAPPVVDVQHVVANGEPLLPQAGGLVKVAAGTRDLQIDYASLSLAVPERARFKYRLRGLSSDWQDAGTRRQAFYTNLGPGHYDFEVQATNDELAWNATPTRVAIDIPPTFVQSTGFRVLCGVLALALIALLVRMRVRQLEARAQERYRVRLEERTRIAQDLHDTLLQGLQGLLLRFQRVARGIPGELNARSEMERVLDQADEVVIEGRNRVTDLRLPPPDVRPLEQTLDALGRDLSGYHESAFSLHVEGEPRPLDAAVHSELALVAREGLFNAFQHAKASRIDVTVSYTDAAFQLKIADDGVGVPAETLASGECVGHWGLSGMRERTSRLGGSFELRCEPGAGTEIHLSVPAAKAYRQTEHQPAFSGLRRRLRGLFPGSPERGTEGASD